MQKGNRGPRSAYHEWHNLPPLQNHQSRCRRSRHHIRRADHLLGPSMKWRLLFPLPLQIQVVLLFQQVQTLAVRPGGQQSNTCSEEEYQP